jgi:hypothetical protein
MRTQTLTAQSFEAERLMSGYPIAVTVDRPYGATVADDAALASLEGAR